MKPIYLLNILFITFHFALAYNSLNGSKPVVIVSKNNSLFKTTYYKITNKVNWLLLIDFFFLSLLFFFFEFILVVYSYCFVSHYYYKYPFFLDVFYTLDNGFSCIFHLLLLIFYFSMLKNSYLMLDRSKISFWICMFIHLIGFFFALIFFISGLFFFIGLLFKLILNWNYYKWS